MMKGSQSAGSRKEHSRQGIAGPEAGAEQLGCSVKSRSHVIGDPLREIGITSQVELYCSVPNSLDWSLRSEE